MHDQFDFFQAFGYILENPFSDVVLFEKMSELQERCGIRILIIVEVESKKSSHRITVIDGFFHFCIGKIKTVLHKIQTEHGLNVDGPTSTLLIVVIRQKSSIQCLHGIISFIES